MASMTAKQRRKVKHTLKTNIDQADVYISLSNSGAALGATEDEFVEDTKKTRELITSRLIALRDRITDDFNLYIDELNNAIEQLK